MLSGLIKRYQFDGWRKICKVLVDSFIADEMPVERTTAYPDDHTWWIEYRRLRRESTQYGGQSLRRLAESANYRPNDTGKDFSDFFLVEAAHDILEVVKGKFLKNKSTFGLGTIEGRGYQDMIVNVLRDCLWLKLDIDQHWYHFTLGFFD